MSSERNIPRTDFLGGDGTDGLLVWRVWEAEKKLHSVLCNDEQPEGMTRYMLAEFFSMVDYSLIAA